MRLTSEILDALDSRFSAMAAYVRAQNDATFAAEFEGKWTQGQQVLHLIRATQPVNLAFRLPKFALRWMFGKANRPSRSYDELVQRYRDRLSAGGRASGRFVPPKVDRKAKEHLLATFLREGERLRAATARWSEADLDLYVLPHPLLGKLTLREMLYFTVYHTEHHHNILLSREQAG